MEKFFDIKCRQSGLVPDAVVLVATVRALKMHGGGPTVIPGRELDAVYKEENLRLLREGCKNMAAHVTIAKKFGIPVIVGINQFHTDTKAELDLVKELAKEAGAYDAVVTNHWAEGGEGAKNLAKVVVEACDIDKDFKFLYDLDLTIKEKIELLAKEVYGADGVEYTQEALGKIEQYEKLGYGKFPICMAKSHLSLSHDPKLKNVPKGFIFPITDIRASVGAGFLYPLAGDVRTMPGLSSKPAFMNIDIDTDTGRITGLF